MIDDASETGAPQRGGGASDRARARFAACVLAALCGLWSCDSITGSYEFAPATPDGGDGDAAVEGDGDGDGVAGDAADALVDSGDDGGLTGDAPADAEPDADAVADADPAKDADAAADADTSADVGADAAADGQTDGATVDTGPGVTIECNVAADCGKTVDSCTFYVCLAQQCVLKAELDGVKCDDGFACTEGDACKSGACNSGKNVDCACLQDADCVVSGSPCAGKPYCSKAGAAPVCKTNPASAVKCSKAQDNACQVAFCNDLTGACEMKLTTAKDGSKVVICEDGSPCTGPDSCDNGKCVSGLNSCGCTSHSDCKGKGDLCTGELYCDVLSATPTCIPNPLNVVDCEESEDPCAESACDPKSGKCVKTPLTENAPCDDGNPCTSDSCIQGACTPGVNNCGCKIDADCADFEDGNPCNGVYYCDKGAASGATCKVNPSTLIVCSKADDSECKTAECSALTGKCGFEYADKFAPCDADGDPCTEKDNCDGQGKCLPGTNTCSCQKDADCADSDDEDLCNGTLYCDIKESPAVCKINPKSVVTCPQPAANSCLQAACGAKTGACSQVTLADTTPCEDGEPCTKGDDCQGGKCMGGTNFCDCKTDADCIGDGDLCNGVEYCQKSTAGNSCKHKLGSKVQCPPGKTGECLVKSCQPSTGACVLAPQASSCDDSKPCTLDICDSAGKCLHNPAISGSACDPEGKGSMICADTACVAAIEGMVWVGSGNGYLGCSPTDTQCAPEEGKSTPVTLAGFWIDRREVSVADWAGCVLKGLCSTQPDVGPDCNWKVTGREKHPVNCVNHAQAAAYCNAMGKRLPTEAEWERAARGGCATVKGDCATNTPIVPWGTPVVSCEFTVMMGDTDPGCDLGGTAPVASWPKDDSPYGARDLGGNVAEWTFDAWAAAKWLGQPLTDPKTQGSGDRVVRGGNYTSTATQVRSSRRIGQKAQTSLPTLGFRCADNQP